MTVSSGFFNSVNHDRLYDAEQLSSIFDGVIVDGVYENVGEAFNVIAYPDAYNTVLVGTGRAWFDHTWTLNDSRFSITLDPPNEMLGRIDAIVIDVNKERDTRKNSIIYLKGDEATPDFPPTLINTENHHQYPIAYITRHAEQNGPISQSDIEITVGTGACPIATGVLEAQNLENLMQQLDSEFNEWWDGIKEVLDENVATNLQNQIDEIKEKLEGDTALVGLLEKPIADAFMSGDYGLDVTSYSVPLEHPENELQNTIGFLLNGETCSISFYRKPLAYPTPGLSYENTYTIGINITSSDGVVSKQEFAVSSQYIQTSISLYSSGSSTYSIPIADGFFTLVHSDTNSYPAKYVYLITYVNLSGRAILFTPLTISISSSGTVQTSYGQSVTPSGFPGDLQINTRAPRVDVFKSVTSVEYLNNGRAVPVLFESANTITAYGDTFSNPAGCAAIFTSDQVLSQTVFQNLSQYATLIGWSSKSETSFLPWMNKIDDATNAIVYFNVLFDSFNNQVKDSGIRALFDLETLNFTVVNDAATYPLPSKYPIEVKYGVETYSLSEVSGVTETKMVVGGSKDVVSEKRSDYFLAATNLCEPLPEGTYIAANDDGRLYGIAGTGEQIAIGTNGGAAILKTEKTVSNTIDINKVVVWEKGYINTNSFTSYLMINGSVDTVLTYPLSGMTDHTDHSNKTAFVVKISRGGIIDV